MFEIVARELRAKLLGRRQGQGGLQSDALSHTQQHSTAGVEGAGGTGGPGRGAGGRRCLAGLVQTTQAPPVWRAPEGPEGLAAVPVGGGAWPG